MVASVTNTNTANALSSATTAANSTSSSSGTVGTLGSTSAQQQTANFMQLLVAQLNNQDPMNPMDNAQMTSQIAQINTVSGIQSLNTTLTSMASQFSALQGMQGASLIGHTVTATGNSVSITNGTGVGAFNLSGDAGNVSVQIMSPGGQVVDTVSLGALGSGNHTFNWDASSYTAGGTPTFNVVATQGSTSIPVTTQVLDTVASISTDSTGTLNLNLSAGATVPYSSVTSIQ